MNRIGKTAVQIAILCGLAFLSNFLVAQFSLTLPGSVVGIVLLFGLLQLGILRLEWIETGANLLLAELLLFFIPSAVGVVQYRSLLFNHGIAILIVVVAGSVVIMAGSGLLATQLAWMRRKS